jgi:hypothetical protein
MGSVPGFPEELTGAGVLLLRGAGLLLLQIHHPRHQFDHLVMPGLDIVIK